MSTPSPRQAQLLDFLIRYQEQHGFVPSLHEMREDLGLASVNAITKLLSKLEALGAISREEGARRAIRILSPYAKPRVNQLPLLGRIAAGTPITSGEHVAEYIDINPAVFSPQANLLFRVRGRSMVNAGILDNDLVGVHLQNEVSTDQIVAAVVEHPRTGDPELTLKTFRRRGAVITLVSENDDQDRYPPLVFDVRKDSIQIVGIYCGLVRSRTR